MSIRAQKTTETIERGGRSSVGGQKSRPSLGHDARGGRHGAPAGTADIPKVHAAVAIPVIVATMAGTYSIRIARLAPARDRLLSGSDPFRIERCCRSILPDVRSRRSVVASRLRQIAPNLCRHYARGRAMSIVPSACKLPGSIHLLERLSFVAVCDGHNQSQKASHNAGYSPQGLGNV